MKGNGPLEAENNSLDTLFIELTKLKNLNNLERFNEEIRILYEKAEQIPLLMIQKFIIIFYSHYNNLVCKEQNNYIRKLIQLATIMINNFKKPNILNIIQSEINQNFIEDFKNYKIFADKYETKDCFKICFSLCILSKNIELMKIFFTKYLEVSLFNEDKFNSLILNNPITGTLFNSLFISLYEEIKNNRRNNLDSIIKNCLDDSNISFYNMLRCNKCCEIKMIKLKENNNFEVKCAHCDKNYSEFTEYQLNETIYLNLSCASCNNKLLS